MDQSSGIFDLPMKGSGDEDMFADLTMMDAHSDGSAGGGEKKAPKTDDSVDGEEKVAPKDDSVDGEEKVAPKDLTALDQETDSPKDCETILKADGFQFSFGIDNYAFASTLRKNKKIEDLKKFSREYLSYLEIEGKKNFGVLKNITKWCQIFNFEIELYEAGFTDRYRGLNNYRNTVEKTYNSQCDDPKLNKNTKSYCEFLKEVFSDNNMNFDNILEDPGSFVWSKMWVDETIEGPERMVYCVGSLEQFGYQAESNGLTNYVERSFKKFNMENVEKCSVDIERAINMCETMQWVNFGIVYDYLDNYYTCYLIVYTRKLSEQINTFNNWCEANSGTEASPGDTSLITACKGEIKADKLDFELGIDSYAQLKQFDEEQLNKQNAATKGYVTYLKEQVPTIFRALENTHEWCTDFECEVELHKSGFTGRFDGSDNYELVERKYKNVCTTLRGRAKKYCEDLITLKKSSTPEGTTIKDLGSSAWCEKNKSTPQSNATSSSNATSDPNATPESSD